MLEQVKHLVLEGGGIKCTWQAGFISVLNEESRIRPDFISSVSASSAIACAMITGRLEWAIECFKACIANNKKNIYLSNLFGDQPVFPHAAIYRETLIRIFDQSAIEALYSGPEIHVLLTRTSSSLPGYPGILAGLAMCALKGQAESEFYRELEARVGFSKEFVSVKKCRTPAELADLVLASSCTPPVTPLYSLDGRIALDGGLVENVPVSGLPEEPGPTLVLLARKRNQMNGRPGFVYAGPSQYVNVASWDYTDPAKIDYLYALGRRDGYSFLGNMESGKLIN
ncbi:MAG TPA: patatin-like phospholipase family protein [Terriglobales bacterium]|jgi:predicted acylesterase/phospholipase RssA|nr:patatin-like phospholipase family protein [Terriglobales bacterium]